MMADNVKPESNEERAARQMVQETVDAVDTDDWFCEVHHWKNWPHDDCIGPGIPPPAALRCCAVDVRRFREALGEISDWARDEHRGLHDFVQEVLRSPLGYCGDNSTGDFCDKAHGHGGTWHHNSATGATWRRK